MISDALTTLFVVPVGNSLPSSGSTQDLTAGQVGFFKPNYTAATSGTIDDAGIKYFYIAQGRENSYLQATKKSDKIAGYLQNAGNNQTNVTEFYKIAGCTVAATQVTDVAGWNVKCGDIVTITLRAFSSYIDTLYFNGFTRSITLQAPCCDCGADPCDTVDVPALIDAAIIKFQESAPGINPDNISFNTFYQFQRIGNDADAILRISGKPLTVYGQPCDVAAFPFEYDRMWFRTFVYSGPATTADFIVEDDCNIVATATVTQRATFQASGSPAEIKQLEKDYYSYQAGYLKSLVRMDGYNANFESWVSDSAVYDQFVIKFNTLSKTEYNWGDYVKEDATVIIACPTSVTAGIEAVLEAALGTVAADNACVSTTSTTTTIWATTSTTSTLIP
jgi:hypothetical protein